MWVYKHNWHKCANCWCPYWKKILVDVCRVSEFMQWWWQTIGCSKLLVRHTKTNVLQTSDACAAVRNVDCWWNADEDVKWCRLMSAQPHSRRESSPLDRYQITLLGDRGTCVWTTCPGSLPESEAADIRTRDRLSRKYNAVTTTPPGHFKWRMWISCVDVFNMVQTGSVWRPLVRMYRTVCALLTMLLAEWNVLFTVHYLRPRITIFWDCFTAVVLPGNCA